MILMYFASLLLLLNMYEETSFHPDSLLPAEPATRAKPPKLRKLLLRDQQTPLNRMFQREDLWQSQCNELPYVKHELLVCLVDNTTTHKSTVGKMYNALRGFARGGGGTGC